MKAAVAVVISPNSPLRYVERSLGRIEANIGVDDYTVITTLPDDVSDDVREYVRGTFSEDQLEILPFYPYWADFINEAIDLADDAGVDYFITLHDDVWVESENFLPRVDDIVSNTSDPVGWITFTDRGYLQGQPDTPPARPGFHTDYQEGAMGRHMYQFHTLPEDWWKPEPHRWWGYRIRTVVHKILGKDLPQQPTRSDAYYRNLPYDMPDGPVKCHAPYTHLMIIEMDRLRQIGYTENWGTPNTLLLDEDWGLEALREGFYNMWVPEMGYVHGEGGSTRSSAVIYEHRDRVHGLFKEKWGFPNNVDASDFEFIESEYGDTNIPWSIGRASYEWDYFE